jgi:hypothetical protein
MNACLLDKSEIVESHWFSQLFIYTTFILIYLFQMLAVHYYMIFDGGDDQWLHMKSFYERDSVFR